MEIRPVKVTQKEFEDLFDKTVPMHLIKRLDPNHTPAKNLAGMKAVAGHLRTVPEYIKDSEGETLAIYFSQGSKMLPAFIYDLELNDFFVETPKEFAEASLPWVWQIRYVIQHDADNVTQHKIAVEADNKKDAIQKFIEAVEDGSEDVWGADEMFDLSGVERTEPKGTKPERQMWYVTGFDPDEEEPEILTKALSFNPENMEEIREDQASKIL